MTTPPDVAATDPAHSTLRTAVVATAGHVDAGKSSLVLALTGTHPDRLPEEQRRGRTIALGFAACTLPSGRVLSLVDVPGHARYVGEALAGLAPAQAVLLVVAADRGWQRQTEEHVDALRALGSTHLVLAVTRADLADPAPATEEALQRLAARLPGASVTSATVSAVTGAGLDELRAALDQCLAGVPDPAPGEGVRLWLDRVFVLPGRGTVVTGTLPSDVITPGLALSVSSEDAREGGGVSVRGVSARGVSVRGVQVHGVEVPAATGPTRVALAVRGDADLHRGDALLSPGAWYLADTVDVALTEVLPDRPGQVVAHLGTRTTPTRVRPLGPDHARLSFSSPLPLRVGDRLVLRDPGGHGVLAGAVVLDLAPLPLRRRGAAVARAAELASTEPLLLALRRGAQHVADLRRRGLEAGSLAAVSGDGPVVRVGPWVVEATYLDRAAQRLRDVVGGLPATTPGLTAQAALTALDDRDADAKAVGGTPAALLPEVARRAGLTHTGGLVRNPHHGLGPHETGVADLERRLRRHPFDAPDRGGLRELGLDARALATAAAQGRLLRLTPDLALLPTAPEQAERLLGAVPQPFSVGDAARALGTSRRVVVPLLEHLDRVGVTLRDADGRRTTAAGRPAQGAQGASSSGGSTTTVSSRAT